MAINENMKFIKNELTSEEKFLEGFVKIERFYKKYKVILISVIAVVIAGSIAYSISSYLKEENKKASNIAFSKFLNNMSDSSSLDILKEKNKKLYEIAKYLKAKSEDKEIKTDVLFLNALSQYSKAINEENTLSLNTLSMKNDFLLKEFALFNKALIETKNKKYEDAKNTLKLIPSTSKVNDLVQILNHYLITK